MITNILFALGGSIAGFMICALFAAGRLSETIERIDDEHYDRWRDQLDAHARCADALVTLQAKRDSIRSIISGNKTVRTSRIAEVIGD